VKDELTVTSFGSKGKSWKKRKEREKKKKTEKGSQVCFVESLVDDIIFGIFLFTQSWRFLNKKIFLESKEVRHLEFEC